MIDETFKLDAADKNSGTWRKLLGHLNEKLNTARGKLEGEQSEQSTARVRGQISTLKALIDLDKDDE